MNKFPVVSISDEGQKQLAEDLSIIVNELQLNVIEIKRVNRRFKGGQGICGVRYFKKPNDRYEGLEDDDESATIFDYEVVGTKVEFVKNPYGAPYFVAFLLDDDQDLPKGALSGAEKGWNREWLASHYADGYFEIVDPEIDADVKERHDQIKKRIADGVPEWQEAEEKVLQLSEDEEAKRRGMNRVEVKMPSPGDSDGVVEKIMKENQELRKQNKEIMDMLKGLKEEKPKRTRKKKETAKEPKQPPKVPEPKEVIPEAGGIKEAAGFAS